MKMHSFKKFSFRKKTSISIGIIFICIFINIFFFFTWFSQKATPKLTYLAESKMNQYISEITSNFQMLLENETMDQLLKVHTNQEGEILSMDYNMKSIYALADQLTNILQENIKKIKTNQNDKATTDGIFLLIPIGAVSDSVFLANLGPKIPILVHFVDSAFSNVKTRAKDYGINNALLEVYLDIQISYQILTPITMENKTFSYELLLGSKVIQGSVPDLYGAYMETRSAFFDVSFP